MFWKSVQKLLFDFGKTWMWQVGLISWKLGRRPNLAAYFSPILCMPKAIKSDNCGFRTNNIWKRALLASAMRKMKASLRPFCACTGVATIRKRSRYGEWTLISLRWAQAPVCNEKNTKEKPNTGHFSKFVQMKYDLGFKTLHMNWKSCILVSGSDPILHGGGGRKNAMGRWNRKTRKNREDMWGLRSSFPWPQLWSR